MLMNAPVDSEHEAHASGEADPRLAMHGRQQQESIDDLSPGVELVAILLIRFSLHALAPPTLLIAHVFEGLNDRFNYGST